MLFDRAHRLLKIAAIGFLVTAPGMAYAKQQSISCRSPEQVYANFGLSLDDKGWDKGSGLTSILRTYWNFMYSSGTLICNSSALSLTDGKPSDIACIGYLVGIGARIELKGELINGAGEVQVHNIDRNVYSGINEGLRLNCSLEK